MAVQTKHVKITHYDQHQSEERKKEKNKNDGGEKGRFKTPQFCTASQGLREPNNGGGLKAESLTG